MHPFGERQDDDGMRPYVYLMLLQSPSHNLEVSPASPSFTVG